LLTSSHFTCAFSSDETAFCSIQLEISDLAGRSP
jgi:hypothetical protein